jgi:hypothetical protein
MALRIKGPGGKLNRSEIVQARLDSKLRFAAEILARKDRRTLSSLMETLVDKATEQEIVSLYRIGRGQVDIQFFEERKNTQVSLKEVIDQIWSPNEADCFAAFALCFPDLLTTSECNLWSFIIGAPYFWKHYESEIRTESGKLVRKELVALYDAYGLARENLREYWDLLCRVNEEKEPISRLKEIPATVGGYIEKPSYFLVDIVKVVPDNGD